MRTGRLCCVLAAYLGWASATGCRLPADAIPPLTGPSSTALSLKVWASPDTLAPNGTMESKVSIAAADQAGSPVAGVVATVDLAAEEPEGDLGALSARMVATGADGQGSVVYTAPARRVSVDDLVVSVIFTPVGGNYGQEVPRVVRLRIRGGLTGARAPVVH